MDLAVTKQVAGVSLIEVLVALMLFSVGVVGVVGLQLSTANNSQINTQFIQARSITNNLANRIKLNKTSVLTFHSIPAESFSTSNEYFTSQSYDLSVYGTCKESYYQCFCQQTPAQIPTCRIRSCTPTELAQFDTYEVACMLASMSNGATIQMYSSIINPNTLLLSINLIWPAQNLSLPSSSLDNSGCLQAIKDVADSESKFNCYSQSLVITVTEHDS